MIKGYDTLVSHHAESSADGEIEGTAGHTHILRRNLTQESLEMSLTEGCDMWIDIVTPEDEEIHWLERLLQLSPIVVADLLREDRRPTLLVYPRYLFLSLF